MTWIKGLGYLAGGLILASVVTWVILWAVPPSQKDDPFVNELSEVSTDYANKWDAERGLPGADRATWRREYNAAVRETCKKHDRPVPDWAK